MLETTRYPKHIVTQLVRILKRKGIIYNTIHVVFLLLSFLDKTDSPKLFDVLPSNPTWKYSQDKLYYERQLNRIGYCSSQKV